MYRDRKNIPVFEKDNLFTILEQFGLLKRFKANELRCFFCNDIANEDNFGAFLKKNNEVVIICSKNICLNSLSKELR